MCNENNCNLKEGFHTQGFTLLELMITLSIAGVMLTLAVPSFVSFNANNRSVAEANRFLTHLHLARNEAVKRGNVVTICARKFPRSNPESCTGNTDWKTGWLVFLDIAGTQGQFDNGDTLLKLEGNIEAEPSFTGTVSNLQYQSTGSAHSAANFTLQYAGCMGNQVRVIGVSLTGRAQISTSGCV